MSGKRSHGSDRRKDIESPTPPAQHTSHEHTAHEPARKKPKTITDGKNAVEALGKSLGVKSQPAQVVLRANELKTAQAHVNTLDAMMDDLKAIVEETVKPMKEQLAYLMHIDEMRICRQAALDVRDWVKSEAKAVEKPAQAFLADNKVESAEEFWIDLNELIDYTHRIMHVGYPGVQDAGKIMKNFLERKEVQLCGNHKHITTDNIQGIVKRMLEFKRAHCPKQGNVRVSADEAA